MTAPVRIANCSGFYGDRLSAAREMVTGGPIDVLTGDYLAELTMLILHKARQRDPSLGYAVTFLRQLEEVLGTCLERGIKIVTNAGGLNPAGLAAAVRALAGRLGLAANVAHVEGDDLLHRLGDLQAAGHPMAHLDDGRPLAALEAEPLSANVYLGGWGIAEALRRGADVVVCPRVTDAALVVGPAAWHHGWGRHDWDRLAGAVVAGHVIECGPQATGGNYAFFRDVPGLANPGFPIAEVREDGSSVITKHPGTGGEVSVGTVTAQLLYEIVGPRYANPDVVARFDTVTLTELADEGPDRVLVAGVRGEPAPPDLKVCINHVGGFRNSVTFVLTGLDVEAKVACVEEAMRVRLAESKVDELDIRLIGSAVENPSSNEAATVQLRFTAKSRHPEPVGRAFSNAAVELALANYPGLHLTAPPGGGEPYGVYWPALVPAHVVKQVVVLDDGTELVVEEPTRDPGVASAVAPADAMPRAAPGGPLRRAPLGTIIGARSGDKGGNANVGFWARTDEAYAWLSSYLTVERFRELLTESAELEVQRYELPNICALNFVVVGLLGEGVAAATRPDPQAKGLGEYLRARLVDIPESLLPPP